MWRAILGTGLVYGAAVSLLSSGFSPISWGTTSFCLWTLFVLSKGWTSLQRSDKYLLAWGWTSVAAFVTFVRVFDSSFTGWANVFYFCGNQMQYCTCDMRWNMVGWYKAAVLWNFVLSSSLAVQKLVIQAGFNGLLPGEEVVTKESFISICWRLIPYWLNNWEQKWGAECSSMMFELPHFAVELLVVLPCVQILCSRMRILALPAGRLLRPNVQQLPAVIRNNPQQLAMLAPDTIRGVWRPIPQQHHFFTRVRSNLRMLVLVLSVTALASLNAMFVPLALEAQIYTDERSAVLMTASQVCGNATECWDVTDLGRSSNAVKTAFEAKCSGRDMLSQTFRKHGMEMLKMKSVTHTDLIPLVETALAVMRLSCERYFVLLSVFAAYLLFHGRVPRWFRTLISINHSLSKLFQQVILNTFPAVCWLYGAGMVFSTFVSLVFWGASARRLYEYARKMASIIQPIGLQDATEEQIERMNGKCAICWVEMSHTTTSSGPDNPEQNHDSKALPCGHAFHNHCIQRWLKQCHGQGRQPTCPLCNRLIVLRVSYRLPIPRRLPLVDQPEVLADLGDHPFRAEAQPEEEEAPGGRLAAEDARDPPAVAQQRAPGQMPIAAAQTINEGDPRHQRLVRRRRCVRRIEGSNSTPSSPLEARGWPGTEGCSSGPLTHRSAPAWSGAPPLPVALTPGTDQLPSQPRLRHRVRRSPADGAQPEHELRFSLAEAAPSHFSFQQDRSSSEPIFGASSRSTRAEVLPERLAISGGEQLLPAACRGGSAGASSSSRSGSRQTEISEGRAAEVRRDRQRATAYFHFCRQQEAQFQASIKRCNGVMTEAWSTATELLRNAERLEALLDGGQERGDRASALPESSPAGGEPGGQGSEFEQLWQQQQQLWARSRELHDQATVVVQQDPT